MARAELVGALQEEEGVGRDFKVPICGFYAGSEEICFSGVEDLHRGAS